MVLLLCDSSDYYKAKNKLEGNNTIKILTGHPYEIDCYIQIGCKSVSCESFSVKILDVLPVSNDSHRGMQCDISFIDGNNQAGMLSGCVYLLTLTSK